MKCKDIGPENVLLPNNNLRLQGGAKYVYNCENTKYRVYSCFIVY